MKITVFGMHEHIPGQDLGAVTRFDVKDATSAELEERVLNALQSVAVFSYQKSDGTERIAVGTVNPALIPDTKELKRLEAVKNLAESMANNLLDTDNTDDMARGAALPKAEQVRQLLTPKETKTRKASTTSVAYYDLTVGEWRSYKPETLLSLLDITG